MIPEIIFSNEVGNTVETLIADIKPDKIFVLTDSNVQKAVLPELRAESQSFDGSPLINILPGEENKNLETIQKVWETLTTLRATRSSLLINIGGGVVTDLGGFAAATFKRGIRFINIPTTLLAAVDASVGGKTGINFQGYKNEIGAFAKPSATIISTRFFKTLPSCELLSGIGEMLKHALLDNPRHLAEIYNTNIQNSENLLDLIKKSVAVKQRFVDADFREGGIRKALNFGHTAGHAFEEFSMNSPDPIHHGHAVAHGCVVAMVLSHLKSAFPSDTLHTYACYVRNNYKAPLFNCDDYPKLLELMQHDKKNDSSEYFNFTLLYDIGKPEVNVKINSDDIRNALDIYRDLMGI